MIKYGANRPDKSETPNRLFSDGLKAFAHGICRLKTKDTANESCHNCRAVFNSHKGKNMKTIQSLSIAVLTAAILAACGGGEKSAPAASQPQAQQAQSGESAGMSAELSAVIENYPAIDPVLTQPIEISDKKSPTGLKELKKFADLSSGPLMREALSMQKKIQSQVRAQKSDKPSDELLASVKEMGSLMEKMKQEVSALNLQDPEIKTVSDRSLLASETAYKIISYTVDNADKMNAGEKSQAFMNAFNGKTREMQKALSENQRIVGDAARKLSEKYSK